MKIGSEMIEALRELADKETVTAVVESLRSSGDNRSADIVERVVEMWREEEAL